MTLKNLKIIIVDEVSMVSNLNLIYLHMRLEDTFGTDEWFGSKNILFVGDLLQLPPVNGRPVFNKISNKLVKLDMEQQMMQLTYGKKQWNMMN